MISNKHTKGLNLFQRILKDARGQVLPFTALAMTGLLGMGALVLDAGRTTLDYRKLQAATDAAALAGAQGLPNASTAMANATSYSAITGDENVTSGLSNVSMVTGYPVLKCLTTLKNQGLACGSPANANAIQVKEQVTVPMYFAGVLGFHSITLTATATAAARGANPHPYNVAVIMDATLSQNSWDSDCSATEMTCSLNGVKVLLQNLYPCNTDTATCSISNGQSTNSVDRVAMFTFPAISIGTAQIDADCTTPIPSSYYYNTSFGYYSMMPQLAWWGVPTALPYTFPTAGATTYAPTGATNPTYQVTPFLSDYKASDTTTTLNNSSALVKAVGGVTGCGAMAPPNYDGDYGTYYAGVIYAAQSSLVAEQKAYPGSQNVIILLSDGDATAPQINGPYTVMPSPATGNGSYPSWVGECGQAVVAAKAATAAGTTVYTVAYGSEPSGCVSDMGAGAYPNITPCETMQDMASSPQNFYSDYNQEGSNSTCYATVQSATALSDIFASIAKDMTDARLIPDSTP